MSHPPSPETCPVCGATVPRNSRSCPECGADEKTGWDEDKTRYDGLDLPDDAFEEDTTAGAARRSRQGQTNGSQRFWKAVGLALLIAMILAVIFGH